MKALMLCLHATIALSLVLIPCANAQTPATDHPTVLVNGKTLDATTVSALKSLYGTVYAGRYWYDSLSGLYGQENGPPMGQLHAGLAIGGALSASASGGGNGNLTGVFVNGREMHPHELQFYRQLFGSVIPGRYWLNAQGIGGFENLPASFNIRQALSRHRHGKAGGRSAVYMDWIGGKPGTHVGRASDGCVYVSQGSYSADYC